MPDVNTQRRPAPREIPAYVRNLNAIAERVGMDISMYVEPYNNDPEQRLWSCWRGTKAQLRSTDLLSPAQSDNLNLTRNRHYDLFIGGGSWWQWNHILHGEITMDGDQVCYEIDSGPADYCIEQRSGVEVIHSAELTTYHGSAEALLALGIERKRIPTGERGGRWGLCETPKFATRRQPDGSIVYRLQTQQDVDRQQRERQERDEQVAQNPTACRVLGLPPPAVPKPPPQLRLIVEHAGGAAVNAAKSYLVRGIDPIPPNWEFASGWRALTGLRRSITTLGRLIDAASAAGNAALARDLRRVRTAACQAQSHISGGFPAKEIGPLAKR